MAIKITPADTVFGKCVKERASWRCERCGTQYQEGDRGLHTSHGLGRQWGVRFVGLNAIAACYGCHQIEGGNWQQRMLTEEQRLLLRELADDTFKQRSIARPKAKVMLLNTTESSSTRCGSYVSAASPAE